jgi:hypothetical protein
MTTTRAGAEAGRPGAGLAGGAGFFATAAAAGGETSAAVSAWLRAVSVGAGDGTWVCGAAAGGA